MDFDDLMFSGGEDMYNQPLDIVVSLTAEEWAEFGCVDDDADEEVEDSRRELEVAYDNLWGSY